MSPILRAETPADRERIFDLLAAAFCLPSDPSVEPIEVGLTRELLACPAYLPELSVVAEENGVVLGYAITTRAQIGPAASLGLGPIGVLPEAQGKGVGSALVLESVRRAEILGEASVALLGDPSFYSRFGFRPAAEMRVVAPEPAWGEHFMILAIGGAKIPQLSGERS